MTIEVATYIGELVTSNPEHDDLLEQGDDHLRLLKTTAKNTFPNATKPFYLPDVVTKSTTSSLAASNQNAIVLVTSAATITLPSLDSGDAGWEVTIQNTSSGTVVVAPPSGTINGAASISLTKQYACVRMMWTGSAFVIVESLVDRLLRNVTNARLLGRSDETNGLVQEISLGVGLAFSGTTLVATTLATFEPQGRLTATSGAPVNTSNVNGGSAIYYTPYTGDKIPLYSGSAWEVKTFTELTLTLNSTSHPASTLHDVFVFDNSGTLTLGTAQWSTSTEGSGARSSGSPISRLNGLLTNTSSISLKNGSTTYSSIGAGRALYVGTIGMDATNGQLSCHVASSDSIRRWGIWNAYHRKLQRLVVVESSSSWTLNSSTIRASNNDSNNRIQIVQGIAEEGIRIQFDQNADVAASKTNRPVIGVGKNSTSSMQTHFKGAAATQSSVGPLTELTSRYSEGPFLGMNSYYALEGNLSGSSSHTMMGGDTNFRFEAEFYA